jgi:hypothetical protein
MTIRFYDSVEGVESNATQTWEQKASKTGSLRVTGNFLNFYCEYGGDTAKKDVEVRVLVNGVERGTDYHTVSVAGEYKAFSCFGVIEPSVEEDYTISVEIRAMEVGQTALLRRVRLMVVQV